MQIAAKYSHMNGEEHRMVHEPALWKGVQDVILGVDGEACRNNSSRERGYGEETMLYSPVDMNKAFKEGFEERGWYSVSRMISVTANEK